LTEVPEHLLQRSRARRAALGLGGDAGDAPAPAAAPARAAAATPAESAAAATPAAPVAPAAPPPPERIPPYVEAAVRRKRIPFWMIPVLTMLPIWALMYALTLDKPSATTAGPVLEGATVYSKCAGCHGGTGGGGVGPQLSGGAVIKQFPNIADHLSWVMEGSEGFRKAGLKTFGTSKTSIDNGVMPGWATLSAEDLIAVVRHERETLSGEKVDAASLKQQYDEILAMVKDKFPAREGEFKAAIDGWAGLPPDA
jgi:mono/diheme cytochrome c family protein